MQRVSWRIWIVFALAVVVTRPIAAQSWSVSDEPQHPIGQIRFTGTSMCPTAGAQLPIPAYAFPQAVSITRVFLWLGTNFGIPYPVVDAHATLFASVPTGYVLSTYGLDRYAAPNAPHDRERDRRHPLRAGDQVGGEVSCKPVIWWLESAITVLAIIDYEKAK